MFGLLLCSFSVCCCDTWWRYSQMLYVFLDQQRDVVIVFRAWCTVLGHFEACILEFDEVLSVHCTLYTSTAIRGRGYLSNSVNLAFRQNTSSPKYNTDIPLQILEYIIFDAIQLSCQERVHYDVIVRQPSAKKARKTGSLSCFFLFIFSKNSYIFSKFHGNE